MGTRKFYGWRCNNEDAETNGNGNAWVMDDNLGIVGGGGLNYEWQMLDKNQK